MSFSTFLALGCVKEALPSLMPSAKAAFLCSVCEGSRGVWIEVCKGDGGASWSCRVHTLCYLIWSQFSR